MDTQQQLYVEPGYRCRDLSGIGVIMTAGVALIHTALTGADQSAALAIRSIAFGVLLVLAAYGGGTALDKLATRYPVLVRPRHSQMMWFVIAGVLTVGLVQASVQWQDHIGVWIDRMLT